MELVRGAIPKVAHLGDGLHSGLSGRSFGHHQDPDGFDRTVLRLAGTGSSATDRRSCGLDGIERVGLALVSTSLAIGSIHFDDLDATPPEERATPVP